MVIGELALNLTEFVSILPIDVAEKIEGLVVILKAVGIAVIVYVSYIVTMGFINLRNKKRIKEIEKKVNSIDKKLNILLKPKKKSK